MSSKKGEMFLIFFLVFIFFDSSSPESLDTANININLYKGKSIPSVTDRNGKNKNGKDYLMWYQGNSLHDAIDWTKSNKFDHKHYFESIWTPVPPHDWTKSNKFDRKHYFESIWTPVSPHVSPKVVPGQYFTNGGKTSGIFEQGGKGAYMIGNAESLSADMISSLLQAMTKVHNTAEFGQIASTHGEPVREECNFLFCCVHEDSGAFLPWHRLIMNAMNQALMKHNAIVGFPYWDWTTSLFPSLALHQHIIDRKTGKNWENPFFRGLLHFNQTLTIRNRTFEHLQENLQSVLSALKEDDFRSFSAQFRQAHVFIHIRTGGNMGDIGTSSYDPVFYMHHSFVDLIWAIYQKLKPNSIFPNQILQSVMHPFGVNIAQTLNYQKNFGYNFNLDINSNRIVFGGMTLAQIQNRISKIPIIFLETGSILKDKIYAGIFLQSYQTSGKILFNCCDIENCSYPCGYAAIFGGSKERPFIDSDPTKFEVTKTVEKARIPLENLRFKIMGFEDLNGNKLSKNIYQPINVFRPGDVGKDIYIIYFNRNYNLPPKIRVPKTCTFQIESPYKNIIQTQNENNFINCNQANESSFVPAGKKLDIDPGNYYFFDNNCVSLSINESFGSGSYNGSRINIIKE